MPGAATIVDAENAANILGWWREAGFDTAISEQPTDWLARSPATPKPEPKVAEAQQPVVALPPSMDAFAAWLAEGDDVPEALWGAPRLMPAGDPASGFMIMTDVPDPGDAETNLLMAGEVGRLFDRMMAAIGRDRASIYLTSLATVRPPGGRIDASAIARLAEIARHHMMLARPKTLLLMGEAASRALLGMDLRDGRGKKHSVQHGGVTVETIATFHPRFLMERPAAKAEAWKDLQLLLPGGDK